jgi:hypothetical protein
MTRKKQRKNNHERFKRPGWQYILALIHVI